MMILLKRKSVFRIPVHRFTYLRGSAMSSAATVKSLDHFVLTVSSITKSTAWYTQNLGMKAESFVSDATPNIIRHSLVFGQQKINLHKLGKVLTPPPYYLPPTLGILLERPNKPLTRLRSLNPKPRIFSKEVQTFVF